MSKRWSITLQALLVCSVLAGTALAQRALESVSLTAHPDRYNGMCPANITFMGLVDVARGPMVFQYQWERSDGGQMPTRMYRVPGRNARQIRLVEHWRLGTPRRTQEVSMRLRVASGNTRLMSEPARVTIHCR